MNLSVGISKEILGTNQGKADLSNYDKYSNYMAGKGLTMLGSLFGIKNTMSEVYAHSLSPNTAKGNTNGGDINTCSNRNGFAFYQMSIKQEYAKIIDNFFSMFGYKINEVKTPNITGRRNWNYIKTLECNITIKPDIVIPNSIPQEDLEKIKDMFNNGVTMWHNTSNYLDYSQNNDIIS